MNPSPLLNPSPLVRRLIAAVCGLAAALACTAPATAAAVEDQWHLRFLHVADAHRYSQGEGVIVGVVDTGVDSRHPDLAGSVADEIDLTTDPPSIHQTDTDGHGTAMAGLIAAHGRVTGIAPKAKLVVARDTPTSFGFSSANAAGIDWAVDHGARVLCLAFSGKDEPRLRAAIERAIQHDVVVVAAVGNEPQVEGRLYPALYPGVVGAAGVDKNGNHAKISVTGSQAILAAPAVDITSTGTREPGTSGYRIGTGTSDATAIIAGAAALVRSKYPELSAPEVIRRLTTTADDKGPAGRDNVYGYGVVNLVRALTADIPPATTSPASAEETGEEATTTTPGDDTGSTMWLVTIGVIATITVGTALFGVATNRRRRADATAVDTHHPTQPTG